MLPSCGVRQREEAVPVNTHRISEDQVDRAIKLLRAGVAPDEAATETAMSRGTLYDRLRKRGLTAEGVPGRARDQRRPPAERRDAERARRDTAFAMRERGLTFEAIGAELG